jgi:hypothetical protein
MTRGQVFNRTPLEVEQNILRIRKDLKEESVLGEYGAVAIHCEMMLQNSHVVPSTRTINLILQHHGCFDTRYRVRRAAPPRGWHLPEVVSGKAELDSFEYVEDLRLEGEHGFVQLFNGISLHVNKRYETKLKLSLPQKNNSNNSIVARTKQSIFL